MIIVLFSRKSKNRNIESNFLFRQGYILDLSLSRIMSGNRKLCKFCAISFHRLRNHLHSKRRSRWHPPSTGTLRCTGFVKNGKSQRYEVNSSSNIAPTTSRMTPQNRSRGRKIHSRRSSRSMSCSAMIKIVQYEYDRYVKPLEFRKETRRIKP